MKKSLENKEKIKLEIQKLFTNIRTELNEREDILLLKVDQYFDNNYFNGDIIKKSDKLPNKIKISLERGKLIEGEWKDNNKLNILLNDCINIENNLKDINAINESINKYNKNDKRNIQFYAETDNLIKKIKNYGCLSNFDSLILKSEDDINKFYKIFENDEMINNMNLLYRSSRDGFNYLSIVNKRK